MLYSKLYISLLDFYRFDREHYVIGQNENVSVVKFNSSDFQPNAKL